MPADQLTPSTDPSTGGAAAPPDPGSFQPDLRAVVDASRASLVVVDIVGNVTFASGAVRELVGIDAADAVGESILDWLHPDDVERAVYSLVENERSSGVRYFPMVFRLRRANGEVIEADVLVTNCIDDPAIRGIVLSVQAAEDRTQYIDPVRALAAGADHATVLRLIAAGLGRGGTSMRPAFIAAGPDEHGVLQELYGARAGSELTMLIKGFLAEEAVQLSRLEPGEVHSVQAAELDAEFRAWCAAHGYAGLRVAAIGADHAFAGVLLSVEPHPTWSRGDWSPSTRDHWQQLVELATIAFERHRFHSRLLHAATHDGLTGLANRGHFFDRLGRLASRSEVGVLYADLDGFKAVNDTHGHRVGDAVLAEVAARLLAAVRPGDLVGRLGGDEFAIAVPDADMALLDELAARLAAAASEPITTVGTPLPIEVSASIGAVVAPRRAEPDEVVHAADLAMLAAKQSR